MGNADLSLIMIPMMMVIILGYYAFRLLVLHDIKSITGTSGRKLKEPEKYADAAGKLMLFLAVGALVMAGLIYINVYGALAEIVIWTIVFGILWKKMDETYGGRR